jgi:DNA polymerase III sliding clamp (beta) subunit (PCNA family)
LLLAGYFRIRIASLKAFDKVIGGIAWCITSSNFEIEVDYNGDRLDIGFNVNYLLDVLSHVSDETVAWRFNDSNSSALFGPIDSTNFKYVVMPMRI